MSAGDPRSVPPRDANGDLGEWTRSALGRDSDAGLPSLGRAGWALVLWSAGALLPLLIIGERALPDLLVGVGGHPGWDEVQLRFATSGEFFLWICLLSVYTGFAAVALGWLAPEARRLTRALGRAAAARAAGGVGLVLVVAGSLPFTFLGDREREPVPAFDVKVMALWLLALSPSALAMLCATLVGEIARRRLSGKSSENPLETARTFTLARRKVTGHLAAAGGAVALLVLSVGAMRLALEASGYEVAWNEDAQLGLGLLGAAVLAMTFLPVLLAMRSWGVMTASSLLEIAPGAGWQEQQETRAAMERSLGTSDDLWAAFKAAVPIAGPIIAALVGRVFA